MISANNAYAYEQPTHARIISRAVTESNIVNDNDTTILHDIGAIPILRYPQYSEIQALTSSRFSVLSLMADGGIDEDNAPRFVNHFYEPESGAKLDLGLIGLLFDNETSPDWAIDGKGQQGDSNYSWRSARDSFFESVTSTNTTEDIRKRKLGKAFKALGQVLHHIGDMAQPQHVRLDEHCGPAWLCQPLGRHNPSRYEEYSNSINVDLFGSYVPIMAPNVRDYWNNDQRMGLANFTRDNFVSAGTNFGSMRYEREFGTPIENGRREVPLSTVLSEFEMNNNELTERCAAESCVMEFISTKVKDKITGESNTNDYASTHSMFTQDLEANNILVAYVGDTPEYPIYRTQEIYSLNDINFASAHKYLIPRAVGYSTGLINYFFRGKFEVMPPDSGVYAVLDHAVTKQKDVEGFKKVKLKLRNITPNIEWSGSTYNQDMSNGELYLVAKYKKNICYAENLAGEFNADTGTTWWPQCTVQSYRSDKEYIVKSILSEKLSNYSLAADPEKESPPDLLEFEFEKPIPINATDLVFQVVFKGKLGEEEDAVAVTTHQVKEPTYIALYNGTDYLYTGEGDTKFIKATGYGDDGKYSDILDPYVIKNATFKIGETYEPVFTLQELKPGTFFRISILTDNAVTNYHIDSTLYSFILDGRVSPENGYSFRGSTKSKRNQSVYSEIPGTSPDNAYPWQVTSGVKEDHVASGVGNARNDVYYSYMAYFFRTATDENISTTQIEELIAKLPQGLDSKPQPVKLLQSQ